jgi:hypothetical protein
LKTPAAVQCRFPYFHIRRRGLLTADGVLYRFASIDPILNFACWFIPYIKMRNKNNRPLLIFTVIFLLATVVLLILKSLLNTGNINYTVLLAGNAILFLVTLISYNLYRKALLHNNVQAFLRLVYSGMLLKMVICIAAVLVYVLVAGHSVNKIAIFGCFGLYFIYTFAEVKTLMNLSKQKNA